MASRSVLAEDSQFDETFENILTFLRDGVYSPACENLLPGLTRTNARRLFRKQAKRYQLSQCRTELLISRKTHRKAINPILVKVIIDKSQRQRIIKAIHEGPGQSIDSRATGGHLGRDKTINKIGERYFWPYFTEDVRRFYNTCHECQISNTHSSKNTAELNPIPVPTEVWHQIGVDLCSLPKT